MLTRSTLTSLAAGAFLAWLTAPKGPFSMVMRLYWPKAEALNEKWKQPPLMRVK